MSSNGTDLIALDTLKPAEVFVPGGVEKIICTVEAVVRATPRDASTEEGRSAIKSLAYQVARSKTALDDMGKDFVAELKRATGMVDADRRTIRDRFDALRDEVRKPVDDWEAEEESRINAHVANLETLKNLSQFDGPEPTLDEIDTRLADIARMRALDWQEFEERAYDLLQKHSPALISLRANTVRRNEERAELERLRKAEAERAEAARLQREREEQERIAREQQEREDRIAREAEDRARHEEQERVAAAERAAALAEERAKQAELDAERDRAVAAERARLEAERIERARVEGHERSIAVIRVALTMDSALPSGTVEAQLESIDVFYRSRDWQEYAAAAAEAYEAAHRELEHRLRNAKQREELERCDREERIAAEARAAERKRVAEADAAEAKAVAEREADFDHRVKINNEALADLLKHAGLNEVYAKATIMAIARGEIRNIKIHY